VPPGLVTYLDSHNEIVVGEEAGADREPLVQAKTDNDGRDAEECDGHLNQTRRLIADGDMTHSGCGISSYWDWELVHLAAMGTWNSIPRVSFMAQLSWAHPRSP
jgi:hypothetical protein